MHPLRIVVLASLAAAALLPSPAAQAFLDRKSVSPSDCIPYAPDTTSGELQITPTGVYNPGTTTEKVICPLPRDQDTAYVADNIAVIVYYRVLGGAVGRLTCTLYVGSSSMQASAVYTNSASGPLVSAGARSSVTLSGATQPEFSSVPNTLVCQISPKTSLGAIYMDETVQTATP
jgi:hypothetical protein